MIRKLVTYIVVMCQLGMGLLIPAADAAAKSGELSWAIPGKVLNDRYTATGLLVPMWDVEWNTLAQIKIPTKSGYDIRMVNGPGWITKGLRAGGLAGLTDNQIAGALVDYSNTTGAMIYGRYSPELHQLRVSVVRTFLHKGTNVLDIQERPFAPVDGLDFTRLDRQLIMSKTEWRKRYEGNEISGRI